MLRPLRDTWPSVDAPSCSPGRPAQRIFPAGTPQRTCPACQAAIPVGSAFCPACGNPSPTVITDGRAAPAPPDPAGTAPVLERLARALSPKYDVKRLVGRGGFAEIYELWDRDLDRRLACKVLRPQMAWSPALLDWLRRKAAAPARLRDP